MIARIKGLKISQASERTAVTGLEMIPFQDGERNGKIRMIEFKDMTMYIFDPTIVDGKVSQEDYDALKQAIEEGKLIYTINSKRNGLDLATEVAIVGGTIYIESPDFIKEEGTDNISQVVFDTITVDGSLNYSKEQYTTTVIKTTGDGTKVLTDNGQYVYIGNLALTNIKFKDGTNTSTYDLVTNGITFRLNATPCVSWNTVKSGNNIYMDIRIANATASMDGLMSKEDYVELNTTIPGLIEDLKEADSNLNNRIDDLDDKIDKEIADREAEIDRIENKFDGVTDALEDALQKEIEDRKAGDTTITNSLNAFISTKGQPSGLAELDSTGKVPAAQLPSYVDDVLEFSTKAQFPQTGETGKIYVAKDTNLTYRWTGTQYLEISLSLALGETPSTAYPGDKGKANRDALNSMPTKLTSYLTPTTSTGELVKINYKYAAKDGLNYGPLQDDNIDIPSATTTNAGAMSAIDKGRLDSLYNEFGSIQNPGDKLDSLPNNLVTGLDATSRNATSVTINYKQSDLSAASNSYANPITKSLTIPAATQSAAGVMTATDKQNLDVNIPNRITNLDNKVTTEVDRLEELIENSSNDIINDLNVEIQARKDGDNQLLTNINNLLSTMNTELAKKVGKVTVAGSGNAVTTASISGDTLTLTKGATYNNYVHPAGSAPSKSSGFYKFSTDSTSHVASVTAVTKADITALGIPALNTNTTYTFANGSAGNFTVTPSGGSAQTVSVGKPANAGNADTVGGISPSAFVKKAGDTMTGNLTVGNTNSYHCVLRTDGVFTIKATSTVGGWNRGYEFVNANDIVLAKFGAYGSGLNFNYCYIGTSYEDNNTWQRWNSSGSVITVPATINQTSSVTPLTLHGTDVSSYVLFINSGAQTAEVGYTNSLGAYLYNDKLTTHPCISLGRVDSLDEGATFYYGGTHYKLLHKGNYANELDKRYSPYTAYNYDKGCLVKLRIPSNGNTMVTVRIFGNSYDSKPPFDTVILFYNYDDNNEILQPTGVNNGTSFGDIKAFIHQGYVHLWFKLTRTYLTFHVHAYTSAPKDNLVQSITNAAMPTSGVTREVTITPKLSIYSYDNITVGNVTSSGKVSASGGFFKESDARLKSDIKPLDYTLDLICSIPTVSFIMNDLKQIGTIALNLEELGFEDIVTESDTPKSEVSNPEQFESFTKDGEEYVKVKKVEYEMLGVLAIEGVKMLKDEIEKLNAEIETLKNKQHE
ncbi:hypothetical protein KNV56_gp07 [uncultured phage cr115_1]|uniref:Peptidase S74 domain-containing protein n=1 Tax=uncultured phage cr115_1 TaxID=2772089 RepID=A0A7M1S285_9CAUD|nr:hypothetical protein KNV56_gp07 [uncultured phage cr115_1]QOR60019.1 hypothetical protein [uncultured phage cr115_1]